MTRPHDSTFPTRLGALLAMALVLVGFAAPSTSVARVPEVATVTFAAPRSWEVKPRAIALGDSGCSPSFSRLHWSRWSQRRANGRGVAYLPRLSGPNDSCGAALQRTRPVRVRLRLSRARWCRGHFGYGRISWRAAGRHGHYQQEC